MNNGLAKVKEKILNDQLAIGTHVKLPNPQISEIVASCGLDIVWIDSEHGGMDKKDIDLHIMAIRSSGSAPFVRIPWNDPVLAKPVLEMGPAAVIFPLIRTAEDTKLAVSACRYPPKGIRGWGPSRAINYGNMDVNEYIRKSEHDPWVIIQIESEEGINNLKDILKVEGVDTVVIGPYDLSGSVGFLGQIRNPKVLNLMDKYAELCREAKIPFGTSIGFNEQNIIDWVKRGVNWICIDTDISYLVSGTKRVIDFIGSLDSRLGSLKPKKENNYLNYRNIIEKVTEEVIKNIKD